MSMTMMRQHQQHAAAATTTDLRGHGPTLRRPLLRRRLNATMPTTNTSSSSRATGGSANATLLLDDDSGGSAGAAFDPEQLIALRVSGWLAVTLYTLLTVAVLWMTFQHFRHASPSRKRVFHVLLLASVVLNLPDPLGWLVAPEAQSWIFTYPLRIYSLLLQSVCKSIISICWSEVVSAGQTEERRRITYVVTGFNAILLVWGLVLPILLAKYPNDAGGQFAFMQSSLRKVFTYTGVGIIFIYGLILTHQGMRLRRRLLLAKGTVPVGSVEKSLSQLMLTVLVIVFSDVMRITSLALYELKVDMPMTTFLVCNNLIPNIFPTICMLYLMRRVGRRRDAMDPVGNKAPRTRHVPATLSRYMTEDRDSDLNSTPVLGMSKFALPSSHIASIDRVDMDDDDVDDQRFPAIVDSKGSRHGAMTPTSHWVRE